MKKIFFYLPLVIFAVFLFSSCYHTENYRIKKNGDHEAKRAANFHNQPAKANVENAVLQGQFKWAIAVDEFTIAMEVAGDTIYVRYTDKAKATMLLNDVLEGKFNGYEVWGIVQPTATYGWFRGRKFLLWEVVEDSTWHIQLARKMVIADSVRGYNLREIEKKSREKSKIIRAAPAPLPSKTTVTKPCESSAEFDVTLSDGTKIHFQSQGGSPQRGLSSNSTEVDTTLKRPGATLIVPK